MNNWKGGNAVLGNIKLDNICAHTGKGHKSDPGRIAGYGAYNITIQRYIRDKGINSKPVCEFEFTADTLRCGWFEAERQCCNPATFRQFRDTSSAYDPSKNDEKHGCERWYMGLMTFVQAYFAMASSVRTGFELRECLSGARCLCLPILELSLTGTGNLRAPLANHQPPAVSSTSDISPILRSSAKEAAPAFLMEG